MQSNPLVSSLKEPSSETYPNVKLPSGFICEYRSVVLTGSGRGLPLPPSSADPWAAGCGRGLRRSELPRRGTPGTRLRGAFSLRGWSTGCCRRGNIGCCSSSITTSSSAVAKRL